MSNNSSFAAQLSATNEVLHHYFPPENATENEEEGDDEMVHNDSLAMLPSGNPLHPLPFLRIVNSSNSVYDDTGATDSDEASGKFLPLIYQLLQLSVPVAATQFLRTSMNLVTTIAGGHYLTLVQFAAVATGLSFTSLTALNIGSGFCAVMDTLATQEHGRRRNSPEILKYLFRSLWWTFAFYIPVSILYWFSEYFLVYLIHEDLVAPTAHFLKFSFLIIIPMLLVNNLLKFSQCQHVTQLGVIASLLGFLTLIPLLILFKSLEINGIILALAINRSVIVLASLFYIVRHPDLKKTWTPEEAEDGTVPSTRAHVWRLLKESFTEWGELMSFGRKSLPILAAFLADSWAFELLSLLASSLSPLASATWSVLLVIYVQFFSLFIGTAIACAIRVGTSVGQGKGLLARRYALATIVVNLTMCLVVACFLWSGGVKVLLRLLQKNASVVEEGAALTGWVGFTFIGDSMFYATQGAFRGAGLNKELLALVFFSLWGIALPLALVLTKGSGNNSRRDEVGHSGARELIISLCLGVLTAFPLQVAYLFIFVDWNKFNKKEEKQEPAAEIDVD